MVVKKSQGYILKAILNSFVSATNLKSDKIYKKGGFCKTIFAADVLYLGCNPCQGDIKIYELQKQRLIKKQAKKYIKNKLETRRGPSKVPTPHS